MANISTPTEWAQAQLQYMGLPTTQQNVAFLVAWAAMEGGNWNNTAHYNPLNTTLRLGGSTVMGGGNSAGVQSYSSWDVGIQATAETLDGYPAIVAALQSGNPDQANSSGQLGGELSTWSGGGYRQINVGDAGGYNPSSSGGGAAPAAGITNTPTDNGGQGFADLPQGNPQIPGMNDIAALNQYIEQNYPSEAWLLNIPDVATTLEQAVAAGDSTQAIQAAIQNTSWWQTTSSAMRQYEENQATNPADYNFSTPGSTAAQQLAQIQNLAAQAGVTLTTDQAQSIALDSLMYGWSTQQINQQIGALGQIAPGASAGPNSAVLGQQTQTNEGAVMDQLTQIAHNYLQLQSDQSLQQWADQIAGGTQTLQSYTAAMQAAAEAQYPTLAPGLASGQSVTQLMNNQITAAAQLMEVDPSEVAAGLLTDPIYSQIMTGGAQSIAPDAATGQKGTGGTNIPAPMTTAQTQQYIRSTPQWSTTQNARDSAAQVEQAIVQGFGRTT